MSDNCEHCETLEERIKLLINIVHWILDPGETSNAALQLVLNLINIVTWSEDAEQEVRKHIGHIHKRVWQEQQGLFEEPVEK